MVTLTAHQALIGNQSSMMLTEDNENLSVLNLPESSYESINKDGRQPMGNITVLEITEMDKGEIITGGPYGMEFPSNIYYEYVGYEFLGVEKIATIEEGYFQGHVKILVNDSIKCNYSSDNTNKLVSYKSELSSGVLKEVYVNGTLISLDDIILYNGGYVYNYTSFVNYDPLEDQTIFISYFIEFEIIIGSWLMSQDSTLETPYLNEEITEITGYYNYTFAPGLGGLNLTAVFMINPADAEYLNDFNLRTYGGPHPVGGTAVNTNDYTIENNNSVRFEVMSNGSQYSLNFNANFTLEFKNKHAGLWARDYLFSGRNIRKRDYELSIVDGPSSMLISNFRFNESDIPFQDFLNMESNFGRPLQEVDTMNKSSNEGGEMGVTPYFREDSYNNHYYLVKGETDTLTITYISDRFLNVLITDNINVPISGVSVKLYYHNVSYGTLMSQDLEYSVATKETDSRGQIHFTEVPYGDLVIEIVHNGKGIQNTTVNAENTINIVQTTIIHFPTWILSYSLISIAMIVGGLFFYKKKT